jgi:hypothetical protein
MNAITIEKISDFGLADQMKSHTIGTVGDKLITNMLVKEGIMKVRKTPIGTFYKLKTKANELKSSDLITFLRKVQPGLSDTEILNIMEKGGKSLEILPSSSTFPPFVLSVPKIPVSLLHQTIDFFRRVHTKQGTEAAIFIRYNAERGHYIEVPEQDLSGGGVQYKADATNKDPIIMDIHSHHTMAPFFSSTDNGDEKSTQFYGVVGHIDIPHPAVNIRARMDGEDICQVLPEHVFDMVACPDEWMLKIKEPAKVLDTSDLPPYNYRGYDAEGYTFPTYPTEEKNEAPSSIEEVLNGTPESGRTMEASLDDPDAVRAVEDMVEQVMEGIMVQPEIFCKQENLALLWATLDQRLRLVNPANLIE